MPFGQPPKVQPRPIHPVPVTVEPIDRDTTDYDEDFREPITAVNRLAPVTFDAQVSYKRTEDQKNTYDGDIPQSDGHLVVEEAVLENAGYTPALDDMIIAINGRTVEYKLVQIKNQGHYDQHYLVWLYFIKKEKGRQ